MADDKYKVDFEIDTTKAVKGLGDVERAASKTAQTFGRDLTAATNKAAEAGEKIPKVAKATHEQFTKAIAGAAALGGTLGALTQQLGPVGTALNSAAAGAGALYSIAGPTGAALGGLVGAAVPLVTQFLELESSSKRAANGLSNLQNTVTSLGQRVRTQQAEFSAYADALRGFAAAQDIADRLAGAREGASLAAENARGIRGQIADLGAAETARSLLGGASALPQLQRALEQAERQQRDFEEQARRLGEGLSVAQGRESEAARAAEAEADAQSIRAKNAARIAGGGGSERDRTNELEKEKNAAIRLAQEEASIAQRLVDKEWERLEVIKQIAEAEMRAADSKAAAAAASEEAYKRELEAARMLAGENAKAKQLLIEQTVEEERRAELELDYQRTVARTQAGLEGVVDIFKQAREIQRDSESSFGKAFKTALDEWLKAFALQSLYKGIAATAEAIGSAVTNQPNTAAKLAEAGMHFGLAAAAGGASAAIPNGGGGGGGGGGGAARPEAIGGGGGGGGGGTVVINFNGPVSEAEMGRMQQRAARAADRRYGSRR
jgi:hypothetical protein